ncbi:MAG: hypothetical protein RR497_02680 [Oscillospiraceae bacterium]
MKKNKINVIMSVALLAFYIVTYIIDMYTFKIITINSLILNVLALTAFLIFLRKIPPVYYQSLVWFTFCAEFLGAGLGLYTVIPIFDLILHSLSGVLLVFAGHYIVQEVIAKKSGESPSIALACFCSFTTAVAGAAVWEIWEYSGDVLLKLNSQGGSIHDTMQDIIAGTIGALVGVTILYFVKKNGKLQKIKS